MINLEQIVEQAIHLEPLPMTAVRLRELMERSNPKVEDVVEAVSFDQALTGQVLMAANAMLDAARTPVRTVEDAVQTLGSGAILAMAAEVGLQAKLMPRFSELGAFEQQLWRHSVASALAAQALRDYTAIEVPPEAFTAALLHDIGKLALARFLDKKMAGLVQEVRSTDDLDRLQNEVELLQAHQAELGGFMLRGWGLPASIARAVQLHHDPSRSNGDRLCYVVSLAHQVAQICSPGRGDKPEDPVETREALGLTATGFMQLCLVVSSHLELVIRRWK